LPTITFTDRDGRPRSFDDFRGKVVLFNIWATWCLSCRKEMPTLDRLQAQLGGAEFEVVALSIDRGGSDVVNSYYGTGGGFRSIAFLSDRSPTRQIRFAAFSMC
jgi:thiol-disulfide isomerase/thioredoxin